MTSTRGWWSTLGVALVLLGAVAGCRSSARSQAMQVAEAMDRFRKADNLAKPDLVGMLRAVHCSATDVCQARDACLASAEAMAKSLVLKNDVERALVALDAGALASSSAEAQGHARKLDESGRLLDEGFAAIPACDGHIMALKRTYAF